MSTLRGVTYFGSQSLKTVVKDYSSGAARWWNTGTSAFEVYNAADIANYGIATTQDQGADYFWTIPALPASTAGSPYRTLTFPIAGTNLATGDIAVSCYEDLFAWSGSVVYTEQNTIATNVIGTGTYSLTVNVKDSATSANIVGAQVRISGAQSAGPVTTDASGNAVVALNVGTVTLAITAAGYASYNPASQVVISTGGGEWQSSGSATLGVTMVAVNVVPATQPGQTTAFLTTYDGQGATKSGVTISFVLNNPGASTDAYSQTAVTGTSDSNGLLQVALRRSTNYTATAPSGASVDFTTSNTSTFALPSLLGTY